MKRKAYKRTRNRARRYFKRWVYLLGLGWWDVRVNWYDNEKAFRKASGATSRSVAMRINADWRYATATVCVNVPALEELSDDELERGIVHELCHALVNEMREDGIGHEERVVTMLSKAFMWVRSLERENNGKEA
jgi:hypothetical protein